MTRNYSADLHISKCHPKIKCKSLRGKGETVANFKTRTVLQTGCDTHPLGCITSLQQGRSGRLSRRSSRSITSLQQGRSGRLSRRPSRSITSLQQGRSGRPGELPPGPSPASIPKIAAFSRASALVACVSPWSSSMCTLTMISELVQAIKINTQPCALPLRGVSKPQLDTKFSAKGITNSTQS